MLIALLLLEALVSGIVQQPKKKDTGTTHFVSLDQTESAGWRKAEIERHRFFATKQINYSKLRFEEELSAGAAYLRGHLGQASLGSREDWIREAIRVSLGEDANRAVIDVIASSQPTPLETGLELSTKGVRPPSSDHPDDPILLRGHIRGSHGQNLPFWTKVRVSTPRKVIRLKEDVRAGDRLNREMLEDTEARVCPLIRDLEQDLGDCDGKIAARSLRAGSLLTTSEVAAAPKIDRGSIVVVEAISGTARIGIGARAESSGRVGEGILLLNLASKKRFRGVVQNDGSVRVTAPNF